MNSNIAKITDKALAREALDREEIIQLLALPPHHPDRYIIMGAANRLTRALAGNDGIVAGQIGLNVEPCSVDCAFCAYAASTTEIREGYCLTCDQVREKTRRFVKAGANFVSLMATADYPFEDFYSVSEAARGVMPDDMMLSANVIRLGEGIDTAARPEDRVATIEAAATEDLEIAFCIEPIGPEHSPAELADQMLLSTQFAPTACAAMRRIPLEGSRFARTAVVPEVDMALIMAVLRLVYAHTETRTFYIHEPSLPGLMAGANQICAETAANPRELEETGESLRGWTVERCRAMLFEAGYGVRAEPNYPGSWFAKGKESSCC
jgi:biotin synthase